MRAKTTHLSNRLLLMSAWVATALAFQQPSFMRLQPHRIGEMRMSAASSMQRTRPPEALEETVWNFAFGSNLDPEKRSSRGVNGTGIISRDNLPAVVPGYRLAFNLPMFPPVEPGMAALARAREGEVDSCHGLLLELTNAEYQKMWQSEGGGAAKPPYEETVVEARTYDGRVIRAIAFTAAQHTCANYELPPSARYKNIVLKGARASGLDPLWISHLEAIPAASPSPPVKLLCTCYLALSSVLFKLSGGFAGIKPRIRGPGNATSIQKKLFSQRGVWAMGAHARVSLRVRAAAVIRAFTSSYRDLLKIVYRVSLPGGSLRLEPFAGAVSQSATVPAHGSAALLFRRIVSGCLMCVCLLPGAVLGVMTAAFRAMIGKTPFPSMMGAPPEKK